MERTKIRSVLGRTLALCLFLLVGLLYTNQAQAQSGSFTPAEPQQLDDKSTQNYVFVSDDDAFQILSAEIKQLTLAAAQLNGGSAEATNSAKIAYYTAIMENLANGDAVLQAVIDSYNVLLTTVSHYNVPVNEDGIVDAALTLLTV